MLNFELMENGNDMAELYGSCLCGVIKYRVSQAPSEFYFCHCKQCQKVTGSSFAANMIAKPNSIEWLEGATELRHFEHPDRAFSKTFCGHCGSGLPHINKSGSSLVIPAGSLDVPPVINPSANLFAAEQPEWFESGLKAKSFVAFPEDH